MFTKSAASLTNCTQNLIFTDSARTAWGQILSESARTAAPSVLLPSYIGFTEREGSGVFDPIVSNSANYEFYRLDRNLTIDLEHFTQIIASGRVNIALVIHYFGFCRNDMEEISRLCSRHGVLLVEDCAHAFQLGACQQKLGNYGGFSFYSLHKYIATASGGILKINNVHTPFPRPAASHTISQDVLEQYAKTNLIEVAQIRRDNFNHYEDYLPKCSKLEAMYQLADGDIPQSYPLKIKSGLREKLYFHLVQNSSPVTALYYRLIDQLSRDDYPVSFEVSSEILNLPVHQDMTRDQIESLCNQIANFLEGV